MPPQQFWLVCHTSHVGGGKWACGCVSVARELSINKPQRHQSNPGARQQPSSQLAHKPRLLLAPSGPMALRNER